MSVSEILAQKGAEVVTIDAEASLRDAIATLAKHKIGATVVINPHGAVCGIVSERDIVRHIAGQGEGALNSAVSECMTQKVISCQRGDTIDSVMEKMTSGRFRHLPVIESGQLHGIISIGDVVKRKIENAERDASELMRYIAS